MPLIVMDAVIVFEGASGVDTVAELTMAEPGMASIDTRVHAVS
ncbi:hypothetical protein ACRAWC_22880 [Leifsonia sp. L25]